MSATQTQDSFTMNPIDQRELTTFQSDAVTRRLQNRERQRRYRARKRLEAELKISSTIKPSSSPNVQVQVNGTISNYAPRLYCKRDWKKDARRAHVSRDSEVTANTYVSHTNGNQNAFHSRTTTEPILESETYPEVSAYPNNSEMYRHKVGRRDWKADARKKET